MIRKVFCISMQRSGTTSVGDWLEAHGLKRAGWPVSNRNRWSEMWAEGRYEEIFASGDFLTAEVLEDAPWWASDCYALLADRFSDARFILLERDPDDWFRSMCAHSGGKNPGPTDLHCLLYGRLAELEDLRAQGIDVTRYNLLDITAHDMYYKTIYTEYNLRAAQYFRSLSGPNRLMYGRLEDHGVFDNILNFLDLTRQPGIASPRSNATTDEMQLTLKRYLRMQFLKRCLLPGKSGA